MSSLDFSFVIFLWKRCLLGQTKWRGTPLTIFGSAGYSNPPAYDILHNFPTISYHLHFVRISKVWSMVYHESVVRAQSTEYYYMFRDRTLSM